MSESAKPTLAVWKFASCDGCQLTLLNCEDELLQIAESVHIAVTARSRSFHGIFGPSGAHSG